MESNTNISSQLNSDADSIFSSYGDYFFDFSQSQAPLRGQNLQPTHEVKVKKPLLLALDVLPLIDNGLLPYQLRELQLPGLVIAVRFIFNRVLTTIPLNLPIDFITAGNDAIAYVNSCPKSTATEWLLNALHRSKSKRYAPQLSHYPEQQVVASFGLSLNSFVLDHLTPKRLEAFGVEAAKVGDFTALRDAATFCTSLHYVTNHLEVLNHFIAGHSLPSLDNDKCSLTTVRADLDAVLLSKGKMLAFGEMHDMNRAMSAIYKQLKSLKKRYGPQVLSNSNSGKIISLLCGEQPASDEEG